MYWFHQRYGVGGAELGLLFFLVNIATAPTYLAATRIARRIGDVNAVVVTRGLATLLLAATPLMPTFVLASALYLVRMAVGTLAVPVRQSFLMGAVDPSERASAAGLSSLPSQVTSAASPTLAGYLMQGVSLNLPLELAALFQGINALLYYVFFHHMQAPDETGPAARAATASRPEDADSPP